MTMHGVQDVPARWRPARPSDLARIGQMADAIHPDYPERPVVFADRLALHPSGMLLAVRADMAIGYAIGHPWRGAAPMLDQLLGRLPANPDSYWLHDVALLPEARGQGLGRSALRLLLADAARFGLRRLRLAAVGPAERFWSAAGFVRAAGTLPDCYGAGAVAMEQTLG